MKPHHSLVLVFALCQACAEDLGAQLDDTSSSDAGDGGGEWIEHEEQPDGTVVTRVDAQDEARWVYLDLESRAEASVVDPQDSDAWDLAFHRYDIATNGGVSGPGGMEAMVLVDVALEDVDAVPAGEWIADAPDGDDEGDAPDYALGGWYDYDFATHVLTPKPLVYVVRAVDGGHFALAVLDYYDDAGTSGWMTLRWKPLP
jgi:hypothetical protein